jgi:two-component system, OmpR family, response regulator QseB
MRILLVEDNAAMRGMIADHLKERGFAVDTVRTGGDALAALLVSHFDAIILDLGLPDVDGLEVLATLRRSMADLPAIIVSARDSVDNRLFGLNSGADDYIVKPFDLAELEARLRAVLRRPGQRNSHTYSAGRLVFDVTSRQASVGNASLSLTRREAALLEELLRALDRVIPKDTLEERLYSLDDSRSANAVEASVSRLRRKLTAAGSGLKIETQWGIGYRLALDETT